MKVIENTACFQLSSREAKYDTGTDAKLILPIAL